MPRLLGVLLTGVLENMHRLTAHISFHRVGNKTFFVGFVMHLIDLRSRRQVFSGEVDLWFERDNRHGQFAFGIFLHYPSCRVKVPINAELALRRDG